MAQKTNKNGENDAKANETGSFTLLSTAEIAAEAGVTRQYIGRLERAGVIQKAGHGKYAASEAAKIRAFRAGEPLPGVLQGFQRSTLDQASARLVEHEYQRSWRQSAEFARTRTDRGSGFQRVADRRVLQPVERRCAVRPSCHSSDLALHGRAQ